MAIKLFPAVLLLISLAAVALTCSLLVAFLPQDISTTERNELTQDQPCAARMFTSDSVVCVCNSSYCDTISEMPAIAIDEALTYTTSKSGDRFKKGSLQFNSGIPSQGRINLTLDQNIRFQTLKGFGGAFTDSAGINIASLSNQVQDHLLRSYFSDEGIGYNMGRIPMASVDFSTRLYTYADTPNDFEMKNFSLAPEDFQYKIPYIKKAVEMSNKKFMLFASPWTAPAWMKTNNALYGKGGLIGTAGNEYHKAWALYFSRFLEEYKSNGVAVWGVTAQNEPIDGLAGNFSFQCMGWTAEQQRDFIKTDLGPTLHSRGHGDVQVIIGDDQRLVFPEWAHTVLNDQEAAQYVSGIGVHWYMDWILPPTRISDTHKAFPDFFILGTEACSGAMPFQPDKVILGSWTRGERYSQFILEDLNHFVSGWVDWNLALDLEGGPNWVKNFVDAAIIVNSANDEFYKQPIFYHLGHFSKFLREGAVRISVETQGSDIKDLKHVAFVDEENSTTTLIILNLSDQSETINIVTGSNSYLVTELLGKSIQTIIFASK